jgi:hypothetical protein
MNLDFVSAVCEDFSWAIEPSVDSELLSPQECWDPVVKVLGKNFDSGLLAQLTEEQVSSLRRAFVDHFEAESISTVQMQNAIERILRRWPAS